MGKHHTERVYDDEMNPLIAQLIETVMGAGGGVVPPGYNERKRQEAKEKGIIIPICPGCGTDAPFLAGGYIVQCSCGYNAPDPFADFPFNGSYSYGGPDCSGPGDQSSEK